MTIKLELVSHEGLVKNVSYVNTGSKMNDLSELLEDISKSKQQNVEDLSGVQVYTSSNFFILYIY